MNDNNELNSSDDSFPGDDKNRNESITDVNKFDGYDDYNDVMSMDDLIPKNVDPKDTRVRTELWFTGVNIDPRRAWVQVSKGNMERLAEGIYINKINPDWMPEMTPKRRRDLILRHAPRISRHIFDESILMGASAYHGGAVDGVLCVASTGNNKYPHKNVGGVLTIYHGHIGQGLPIGAPQVQTDVEDTLGHMIVEALPDEILILHYFTPYRRRPPSATQLSLGDLNSIIERSIMKYGSKTALIKRLTEVANAMSYSTQLKHATEAVARSMPYMQKKKNVFEYFIYWNKIRTGILAYDGAGWRFDYDPAFKLKLSLNKKLRPGTVPSFIGSVLPETGELDKVIEQGFAEFKLADRYISNITVRRTSDQTAHDTVHVDRIAGAIKNFWKPLYEFGGTVDVDLSSVLTMQSVDPSFLTNAMENPRSPRMSGVQLKLAGHLSEDGVLSLVDDNKKTFTHLIKPPPGGHNCSVGTMEWFSMTLAQYCKLSVEHFAIADIGGYGPTFIAERFDIPQDDDDFSMILMEDFWSIAGLRNPQHKYTGDVMDIAKVVMDVSTDPKKDGEQLFKQVLFSWLTVNSDLHLKNLAIIKVGNKDLTGFEHVRLSPAYDLLCTNVYPKDPKSAALSLAGSKFYTLAGFRDLGKAVGMKSDEIEELIKNTIIRLVDGTDAVLQNLPGIIRAHEMSMQHLEVARKLIHQRCRQMLKEFDVKNENFIEAKDQTINNSSPSNDNSVTFGSDEDVQNGTFSFGHDSDNRSDQSNEEPKLTQEDDVTAENKTKREPRVTRHVKTGVKRSPG